MICIGIGLLVVVIICVIVKLFDEEIRKSQVRKAAINSLMLFGLLMVIGGIVSLLLP